MQVLDFVGEPTFFAQLLEAMDQAGYRPAIMILNANFYDATFAENAGTFAENVHVRLQYTPLELAADNPATADYLELMEQYNPGRQGRPAGHAGAVGVPAVRPVGHGVRVRSSPASACSRRRAP